MKTHPTILILLIITSFSFGQSLKNHHIVTTGSLTNSTESIAIADFDNDGDQDIIASSGGSKLYFMENKGNQEFETISELDVYLGNIDIDMIKAADINNDGFIDIVYSYIWYSCKLKWLKNIGNNNFMHVTTCLNNYSSGAESDDFFLPDLNGDNCPDLVIGSDDLKIKISQCDGSFNPNFSLINEGTLVNFICSDIDSDNDIDIIYKTINPYKIAVSLNNGSGEFSEEVIIDTIINEINWGLHIFDTDNDNDLDILEFSDNDSISIFLNHGGNYFSQLIIPKDTLYNPYGTIHLDFDNDGDNDLINYHYDMLENHGNNSFEFRSDYDFPLYSYCKLISDLNENGDEDILFGLFSGAIGYIEDASFENLVNWRLLTSQVMRPMYPDYKQINNDQYPDICLLDYGYKYVFYLNNGSGEFLDTLTTDLLHRYSNESTFYDINNDGFCDIISYSDEEYSGFSDSSHFQIAKNNGDNTFSRIYIEHFDHLQRKHTGFIDYDNDNSLNAVIISSVNYPENDTIYFLTVNPDFTLNYCDTIVYNLPNEITNYKFHDIDKNGQNDFILNVENILYVNYSYNNRYSNEFDTIIISDDSIIEFEFANITNDSVSDILYSTNEQLVVIENIDSSNFDELYQFEMNNPIRLIKSNDLDNNGIDEITAIHHDSISIIKDIQRDSYSVENYLYRNSTYNHYNTKPFLYTDIDLDGDDDLLCTDSRVSDLSWFENPLIDTLEYSKFPENNAVWTEQNAIYEGNTPQTWTSLYIAESDTILINNSYTNIYEYYLNPITFDTIKQLYASIRQNVLKKKVYIIRHYLSEINEKLLLDFKINIGDTIILNAYYWDLDPITTDSIFVLDSTNTTIIHNGEERDIFYLSNHKEQTSVSLTLIEGVGNIENPFGPATNLVNKKRTILTELCCPDYLICLSENEEIVYIQSEEFRCNTLEVWTSMETETQTQFLKIFPNPTKDKINIEFFDKPLSDFEVVLYNNHGSKLSHFYYKKNEQTQSIDFNKYKSGLYLLRIYFGNKSNSFKIIKTE